MKKFFLLFSFVCLGGMTAGAASLPDNMYFQAMKDEMKRSLSHLYTEGSPKPYYLAYKLTHTHSQCVSSSFGSPYAAPAPENSLDALAMLAAGTPKNDSMGFESDRFYYRPARRYYLAQSYWGIRQALWQMTDDEYITAADSYQKKQAYKRQKQVDESLPDFIRAKQASFVEEIPPFQPLPAEQMQAIANRLSARGKELTYLESFKVSFCNRQEDVYYLNSDGGFYQFAKPNWFVRWTAQLRNQEGYKETLTHLERLTPGKEVSQEDLMQETERFLQQLQESYRAQKAEPYLGPVLLMPRAASGFLDYLWVRNMQNIKPLLSMSRENDPSAGDFRNKLGMRVMSNVVDVYDRPSVRSYLGKPLAGFMPVDDEGVKAQDLTLVSSGRLHALPLARRPLDKKHQSNGHARMGMRSYPREALSNVFVEPRQPLEQAELEEKLLARCRELELDSCYILYDFSVGGEIKGQRIYTQDGRKEPVFGMKITDITTRALRDILAAGNDEEVFTVYSTGDAPIALVTPSLLLDEVEIMPDDKKPNRKPFIPKP